MWGSVDISSGRYGVSWYRLVAFPPGIGRTGRCRLRLWRAWPTWGALLWLAVQIGLSRMVSNWTATGIATALSLSAGGIALALAGKLRSKVRTLSVSVVDRRPDRSSGVVYDELATLAAMLSEADAQRQSGQIPATDHEAVWSRVYDRLGPRHPARTIASRLGGIPHADPIAASPTGGNVAGYHPFDFRRGSPRADRLLPGD